MENCKYHPSVTARWYCPDCDIFTCSQCVEKNLARNSVHCFLCNSELDGVRSDQYVTPFWRAIGSIHKYPFNSTTMFIISLLAVVTVLSAFFFVGGLMINVLMILFLFSYAAMIMEHTAHGNLQHPQILLLFESTGKLIIARQMALIVVMSIALGWIARHLGLVGVLVAAQVFLLLLPAGIIATVTESSVFRILNPLTLTRIIRAIGWPYLLLLVFLYLLVTGSATLKYLIGTESIIAVIAQVYVYCYFTLVIYHLLGYTTFQYHDKLGYRIGNGISRSAKEHGGKITDTSWMNMLNKARILTMEGRPQEAKAAAVQAAHAFPANLQVQAYCYDVLKKIGTDSERLQMGLPYMNVLLFQNQLNKAAAIYVDISTLDKTIKPADGDLVGKLAVILHQMDRSKEALRLISDFHVCFPDHPDTAKNYFFGIDVLMKIAPGSESINAILSFLEENFDDQRILERIAHYRHLLAAAT